jgi:predicted acyltransferase
VFMAGMAASVFACCYWLVDVKGYRAWGKPFAIYGMNAITVYVLAGALEAALFTIQVSPHVSLQELLFRHIFAPLASPVNASLLWAVCFVLTIYAVAWFMYRRKWFWKV